MPKADCAHPEDQLQSTILDEGPDFAYCPSCTCVVQRIDGVWVPDSVPGQITKARIGRKTYRYG